MEGNWREMEEMRKRIMWKSRVEEEEEEGEELKRKRWSCCCCVNCLLENNGGEGDSILQVRLDSEKYSNYVLIPFQLSLFHYHYVGPHWTMQKNKK